MERYNYSRRSAPSRTNSASLRERNRLLNEALGNADFSKFSGDVQKVISDINKAADSVLQIVETLTTLADSAKSVSPKVQQVAEATLNQTAKNILNGAQALLQAADDSAMNSLPGVIKNLSNLSVGDVTPLSAEQKIANLKSQVDLTPHTSMGPQSAITQQQESYNSNKLDFAALKENSNYGRQMDEDLMAYAKQAHSDGGASVAERLHETNRNHYVEDSIYEDDGSQPLKEQKLDFSKLKKSAIDFNPNNFGAIPVGDLDVSVSLSSSGFRS